MINLKMKIVSSRWGEAFQNKKAEVSKIVRRTTLAIEAGCKVKSRVDTGQMRAGWQSEFPEETLGRVFNNVVHAFFNEFGTKHMSAAPMLRPSVEENKREYFDALRRVLHAR